MGTSATTPVLDELFAGTNPPASTTLVEITGLTAGTEVPRGALVLKKSDGTFALSKVATIAGEACYIVEATTTPDAAKFAVHCYRAGHFNTRAIKDSDGAVATMTAAWKADLRKNNIILDNAKEA